MSQHHHNMDETTAPGKPQVASIGPQPLPTLSGYELLKELGRGGMGVVYQARQLTDDRMVAVKLIRDSSLASDHDRARFRIEMEAAARMAHPHIVQIIDSADDAGRPYFAMEYIAGGSLDTYLQGRALDPKLTATLMLALAQAVEHAHRQQIIHRDLKPANILLACHPDVGTITPENWQTVAIPKITDFGLAKRLDHDSTAITQAGTVLGTAAYMAPEQAAGNVSEIGPAVDIYALGAILYELLTGRPPFVAESWNKVLEQLTRAEPMPPSHWNNDVPPALEAVCLKCLEKKASDRYASANDLVEELQRFLQHQPVQAVKLSEQDKLFRLARQEGYEIIDEVGRGLNSVVYRTRYHSSPQPVSLKVFTKCDDSKVHWEERMQQATQSWSSLTHPLLLLNQRSGWFGQQPYASTEYCPMGSLAQKLGDKLWPVAESMAFVEQLAEVVSYLHRQGVIHGNLKPSNVMLAGDNVPRLMDFHQLSGWGHTMCVDGFIAPELMEKREPVISTDLYGLGIILYVLLTGQEPFATGLPEQLREYVLLKEPVPPSQLNPKVPPALDTLCLRCMNKNPWRRYFRAYDVGSMLRSLRTKQRR